jgi:hypothetical protein
VTFDGYEHYEMLLVHVDNICVIYHKPLKAFNGIKEKFKFKNDEVKLPVMYIVATPEYQVSMG